MQSVVSIEAEDPHTVVMTLDASNFDFATLIGHQGFAVVPKDTTDFTNPVGTGPYQIVSFEPGVRARLVRYDDFYSDDEGFFDEIEVINIADAATRTNALRNGDVDVIYRPDVATAQRLASQSGIDLVLAEGGQHYTTPMRVGSGALADNDVRLAIKYGIRRQEFVDRVLGGFGYVGNDTPIGRGYAYYNAEIEQREYDPERARFHFDRAGITASDLPVLSTSDGAFSGAVNAAQLIQASMSEAGIGIDIERVAADGYWSDIWQVVPWCFCYWNGSPVIGQQLSYYTGGHSYNDTAFDSGRFNQLVTEAQVERDDALRAEMYGEAQQILHDEGGTAVIGFSSFVHAASSDLGHGQVGGLIPADDHQLGRRWWWNRT
jgi:peptide/nickel transport system substrate-binding protein